MGKNSKFTIFLEKQLKFPRTNDKQMKKAIIDQLNTFNLARNSFCNLERRKKNPTFPWHNNDYILSTNYSFVKFRRLGGLPDECKYMYTGLYL